MNKKLFSALSVVMVTALIISACQGLTEGNSGDLKASGLVAAREYKVASELGGRVSEIFAVEGSSVKAGDVLFRLDDSLLQAQSNQAQAAVQTAEAALANAQAQYNLIYTAALAQEQQLRNNAWSAPEDSSEFEQPVWYFERDELLAAAQTEVDAARTALETEKSNLEKTLSNAANGEFIAAEKRLANAQAAFLIAEDVLDQAKAAKDNEDLENFAQIQYDAAKAELDSAQSDYDRLLSSQAAADVLEARARVRVAQARYDRALDRLNALRTGSQSLQVMAAQAAVQTAEAALEQAKRAQETLSIQLAKVEVTAPADGVVTTLNLEIGEIVSPGGVVLTIGQLEEVKLTVYVPETEYGRISLGHTVTITTDSFPGETFTGTVTRIADKAEFTPRNVQTEEGRRSTVYAIELTVPNPDLKLKPGMPADVTFETP